MIHQYKLNNFNIVIDANSGAVHSVDDVAYDVIRLLDKKADDKIQDNNIFENKKLLAEIFGEIKLFHDIKEENFETLIEDIKSIKEEGLLWSNDIFEDDADFIKTKQSVIKAICLHVAHGCNMDCEYCFAGKGDYSGKSGIMSVEVGKKALDFLVENSGDRKNLEVDFFGGEPLINWDVCKEVVKYGRELEKKHNKKFNFTLTTNGVLIDDDVIEFTNREMSNVVLSMDGRRKTHNRMRKTKSGFGTYDDIIGNFKKLVDARTGRQQYYMRGTYTAYNTDFADDVIAMADLGFAETSIEPVVSDTDAPYALHESDLETLYAEYEKLALEMLKREEEGKPFNFYHFTVDLNAGPCIYKRVAGCGVATEYLAVTPTGDLYPCHQFVGDDEMLAGNIYDGITNPDVVNIFRGNNNLYTRDKCKDCWVKLYCAGGCAANNYHSNGNINKVYEFGCKLQRKRIECAIMMEAARNEREATSER